jgi:hypothetical protein
MEVKVNNQKLLALIDKTWTPFRSSIDGLTPDQLQQSGASGDWSVKDILAHVTTWEAESLEHLPRMARGEKNASYRNLYGGIDAFNELMTTRKRGLSLDDVLRELDETHARLVEYVANAPEEQFAPKHRCRARLGWDSHKHYPHHEQAIRQWRAAQGI